MTVCLLTVHYLSKQRVRVKRCMGIKKTLCSRTKEKHTQHMCSRTQVNHDCLSPDCALLVSAGMCVLTKAVGGCQWTLCTRKQGRSPHMQSHTGGWSLAVFPVVCITGHSSSRCWNACGQRMVPTALQRCEVRLTDTDLTQRQQQCGVSVTDRQYKSTV